MRDHIKHGPDLYSAGTRKGDNVFLLVDIHRIGLQPPYIRPHWVLKWDTKTITNNLNGNQSMVSEDRAKLAYVANPMASIVISESSPKPQHWICTDRFQGVYIK